MGFNNTTASKKEKAIKLRLEGKSYNQILKELKLTSKGTLSLWFKHLKLPNSTQKKLEKNNKLAVVRGLKKFNEERSKKITKENISLKKQGKLNVGKLTKRELLLIGASLYWGEGTKESKNRRAIRLSFTNSDADMVKVYLRFLREILEINDEKIRGGIHIYPGIKEPKVREFWSDITGLPQERFYITRQGSKAGKGKAYLKRLPNGTLRLNVNSRQPFYYTMGIIDGISSNIE